MTDKKTPSTASDTTSEQVKPDEITSEKAEAPTYKEVSSDAKTPEKKLENKMPVKEASPRKSAPVKTSEPKRASNKLAIFSFLLALIALIGVGGLFYWYQQQFTQFSQQVNQQSNAQAQQIQQQNKRQLEQLAKQQQAVFEQQLTDAKQAGQSQLSQLTEDVAQLQDNRSSDWLLHETQYLIRLASRALWLEDDSQGAIALLRDADARLNELNDPNLLPIREVIHQDIEQLSLLPALESESVILALGGLEQQVESLPLALAYTPDSLEKEPELTLSDNTAEWRENLKKSWQQFKEDFITVRRRTAEVEPLLSPQHQQNLEQNLSLKLQVAQWSVTRKNVKLFAQSIDDIQAWLNSYYDIESPQVIRFKERLVALKGAVISLPLPAKLRSLQMISDVLKQQPSLTPKQIPLLEKLPMPKSNEEGDA